MHIANVTRAEAVARIHALRASNPNRRYSVGDPQCPARQHDARDLRMQGVVGIYERA